MFTCINNAWFQILGKDGSNGDIGPKGEPGQPGQRGPAGPIKGERGDKGEPGERGADGLPGNSAPKGERGKDGKNGNPGTPGPRGEPGDAGDPGMYFCILVLTIFFKTFAFLLPVIFLTVFMVTRMPVGRLSFSQCDRWKNLLKYEYTVDTEILYQEMYSLHSYILKLILVAW